MRRGLPKVEGDAGMSGFGKAQKPPAEVVPDTPPSESRLTPGDATWTPDQPQDAAWLEDDSLPARRSRGSNLDRVLDDLPEGLGHAWRPSAMR